MEPEPRNCDKHYSRILIFADPQQVVESGVSSLNTDTPRTTPFDFFDPIPDSFSFYTGSQMHVFLQFYEGGSWVLPGGRVENEFSIEAAYRELKEEHPECDYGEDEFCQNVHQVSGTDWQTAGGIDCHDSLYLKLFDPRLGLESKKGESKYVVWASFPECLWLFQEKLLPKNIFDDIVKGFVEYYQVQETLCDKNINFLQEYPPFFFFQPYLLPPEPELETHSPQSANL
jgi:hypothetical protein